jgi:hypothetical protein
VALNQRAPADTSERELIRSPEILAVYRQVVLPASTGAKAGGTLLSSGRCGAAFTFRQTGLRSNSIVLVLLRLVRLFLSYPISRILLP